MSSSETSLEKVLTLASPENWERVREKRKNASQIQGTTLERKIQESWCFLPELAGMVGDKNAEICTVNVSI
jgi:hypothetical protein